MLDIAVGVALVGLALGGVGLQLTMRPATESWHLVQSRARRAVGVGALLAATGMFAVAWFLLTTPLI